MKDYLKTPLWNNELSIEERLDYLISELTVEEKLVCLTISCPDIPRLGIRPFILGGEAAHGVEARHDQEFNKGETQYTTSFPQPVGMSGSFDRDLIRECGRVVGEEARAVYKKSKKAGVSRWAPTVDMARDPRWGRTEEAYGEDPYLTGEMASAYIKGMQGNDPFYIQCAAALKHFYANNVEEGRGSISSSIDNRNKFEYYLEPFRKAIVEGGAEGVMTAYNEINGVPAILNTEVRKIVKGEWGLAGYVASDGMDLQQTVTQHKFFETHAESCAAALKAGVDCFPEEYDLLINAAREALDKGLITVEDLDRSVRNTFSTRIRLGPFDNDCPYHKIGEDYLNNEDHRDISLRMAKDSIVLLKNDNNLLPFMAKTSEEMLTPRIAVVGPLADAWNMDWYGGFPPYKVTPLRGIEDEYPEAEISYCSGLNEVKILCGGRFIGLDENSRLYMTTSDKAEVFITNNWGSGDVTFKAKSNGRYVTINDESGIIDASKEEVFDWFVREVWKVEDIKETNTSRKLSRSSGMVNCHIKSWNGRPLIIDENNYLTVAPEGTEENNLVFTKLTVVDGIKEAINLAFNADYIFTFIGTNPVIGSKETLDRSTLALAPDQLALAEKLAYVNPNTVLIIISNYPHTLGKLNDLVSAILFTASGSQDLGTAIAQTLSGRSVPAARLSMTWYADEEHLPDINDYDIIKGNRTYQYFEKEVLYPFGHGLSYSWFTYNNFVADLNEAEQKIDISMTVRNSGYYQADEVIQIYVRKEASRVKQPLKKLVAFKREKGLKPGERRLVTITASLDDLKYFDVISERMVLEEGNYIFQAGASSKDIRGRAVVFVPGETVGERNPFSYTKAINYDDYRNIELQRGKKAADGDYLTCVAPQIAFESAGRYSSCKIVYNDFIFTKLPELVKIEVLPSEVCKIVVYVNMAMIAYDDFSAENDYSVKELKVNQDKVPPGENISVQIQIYGNMKIMGFEFA